MKKAKLAPVFRARKGFGRIDEHAHCLGAAWGASRRIAGYIMAESEDRGSDLNKAINKIGNEIYETINDKVVGWLMSDAESNLQSHIRHLVDGSVRAILKGEKWANGYYIINGWDGKEVRKQIWLQMKDELVDTRITELQKQLADKDIELHQKQDRYEKLLERTRDL